MTGSGSHEISNGELMQVLMAIKGDVGEVKGQQATFIRQMAIQDDRATDHDARIRSVEGKQYWMSGVGSMLGALVGWFGIGHFKF